MSKPTMAYIADHSQPGSSVGRVVMIDPRILIDDYIPSQPHPQWYCDNCEQPCAVTAEFVCNPGAPITLCAECLQNALNGIALSIANPVEP